MKCEIPHCNNKINKQQSKKLDDLYVCDDCYDIAKSHSDHLFKKAQMGTIWFIISSLSYCCCSLLKFHGSAYITA